MFGKKPITALATLLLMLGAPMAIGMGDDAPSTKNRFSDNSSFGAEKKVAVVLAQNDRTDDDRSERSKSGSETMESEAANDDKNKESKAKSKPLKPFVPSEKIPGDQAVDFPVDI
jgi:hypothetical protein